MEKEEKTYKIWYWIRNKETNKYEHGFRTKEYKRFMNAVHAAEKIFHNSPYSWLVSNINPFIKQCNICGKQIYLETPMDRTSNLRLYIADKSSVEKPYYLEIDHMCPNCARNLREIIKKYVSEHAKEVPNDKT